MLTRPRRETSQRTWPLVSAWLFALSGCSQPAQIVGKAHYHTDLNIAYDILDGMELPKCVLLVDPEYDRLHLTKIADKGEHKITYVYTRNYGQENQYDYLGIIYKVENDKESGVTIYINFEIFPNPKSIFSRTMHDQINIYHDGDPPISLRLTERYLDHLFAGKNFNSETCDLPDDVRQKIINASVKASEDADTSK